MDRPKKYGFMMRLLVSSLTGASIFCYAGCGNTSFGFKKENSLVFFGTIETQDIRVGSKVGGRIQEVLVKEGQEVQTGQPLVRFDMAELQAQLAQAQARVEQQRATLAKLERGARPEEKAQARAATETARANFAAVRNWPRPEEVAQARAALAAADAEVKSAEVAYQRAERLRETGDISKQDYDDAKFRYDNVRARRLAQKDQLDLLLNGSRPEDIKAAEERFKQAQEAEKLVLAGARAEDISAARAQLTEAQARIEQIKVQLAEGQVVAPANAVIEVLPVRPGDLLTPNQTVAQLLEKDQIWVRIYVPEPQLGLTKIGQGAKIKVDTFRDRTFNGTIEQINSQGEFTPRNIQSRDERNHQVFGVKVRIDNREGILKSGMAAEVSLEK
jgi:multidrug resistance efflux pump